MGQERGGDRGQVARDEDRNFAFDYAYGQDVTKPSSSTSKLKPGVEIVDQQWPKLASRTNPFINAQMAEAQAIVSSFGRFFVTYSTGHGSRRPRRRRYNFIGLGGVRRRRPIDGRRLPGGHLG